MEFLDALREYFGQEVATKYLNSGDNPNYLKSTTVEVSFEQLIQLWNTGVENGVEGMRTAIKIVKKCK